MPEIRLFLALFLSAVSAVSASLPASKVSIGPEVYYLDRKREGGSKQHGMMYGVRGSYERIKRYKWYIGAEGFYAEGTLKGHTSNSKLKSIMVQESAEGRLGYTFQAKDCFRPSFTPFGGYGYYRESNRFHSPSPLRVKLVADFSYISYGFLSSITPFSHITVGFNAKLRSMYDAKCRVKKDPDLENTKMVIKDKLQYRLELPIYYDFCLCCLNAEIGLVPFYESQHYGGRENFPNDFFDTKLWLYGANLQFTLRF